MCASGYLPKARQKRNASKYLQNELLVTLFVVCWNQHRYGRPGAFRRAGCRPHDIVPLEHMVQNLDSDEIEIQKREANEIHPYANLERLPE